MKSVKRTAERLRDLIVNIQSSASRTPPIKAFFANAELGEESTSNVTARSQMIKRESEKGLFFETRDLAQKGIWVHRSYLAK
jgi:hypothetical protein